MKREPVKKREKGPDYLDRCAIKTKKYIQGSRLDGTILDIMPIEGRFSLSEYSDKGAGSRYVGEFRLMDRNGEMKVYDKDEFSLDKGDDVPGNRTPHCLNHRMVAELRDWIFIGRHYIVVENDTDFRITEKDVTPSVGLQAKHIPEKRVNGGQLRLFPE